MKNKQICPYCGNKLTKRKKNIISDYVMTCEICKTDAVCTKESKIFDVISRLLILLVPIILWIYYKLGIAIETRGDWIWVVIPLLCVFAMAMKVVDAFMHRPITLTQCYDNYDENEIIIARKSIFSAQIVFSQDITQKQYKREFVKNNILEISANGEKEYIILTKADFETGKCEATFPALKKENGLKLLEKYSEFELSNGEEIIGILKVEKVFEA